MFHVNDLLVEIMRKVLASLDIPDGASGVDDGAPYALDGPQVPKRSSLQQETLESATLVCRSWSKIAQCILFQKIEVCYSAEPLLAVLETRSDLAASVEILAINPYAVDPFDGFAENLVSIPALLRLLPNLRKYSFQLLIQDMQTRHEYFPTSSHNGRLQYFGSSRFGSYSQASDVELSKEAEQAYLNLSQSLRRLDLRSVRFGATKLPCLKNLETLCIDGDTFKSLSCQVVEDCPSLRAFYLTYPLDISDGAVFSGIEYLCVAVKPPHSLRNTFPNLKHLDLLDWGRNRSGERVVKDLPRQLKVLTWTCWNVDGLANLRTLLRQMCMPSFLPGLESVPEIYSNLLHPEISSSLDGATLGLMARATEAFALRKLPSIRSYRRALPTNDFEAMKIFPVS